MRIGLTHSRRALPGLARSIEEHGLTVEWQPLVETRTVEGDAARESAMSLLACDWLVFPSRSAVRAWTELGLPTASLASGSAVRGATLPTAPRVAAVGLGTEAELLEAGMRPLLTGSGDAASTAARLIEVTSQGDRIGLVQGDRALPTLAETLRLGGRRVSTATAYRTLTTSWRGRPATVTVLASPSAAAAFGAELLSSTIPVAVGHVTATAVRRLGCEPIVADAPYVGEVSQAVVAAADALSSEVPVP